MLGMGIECRTLHTLRKNSTTELETQHIGFIFYLNLKTIINHGTLSHLSTRLNKPLDVKKQ